MHATRVLEIWLRRNCPFTHRARQAAVVKIVDGVVFGGKATLAELGREIRNRVLEKHNVKCADRLVGNAHLGGERLSIYQALAHWLLSAVERPWIIVDCSDVELGREHLMLKAAVPVGGRAGLAAKAKGWARHFQANTVKDRAVLSVVFLGRRVLKSYRLSLRRTDIWDAAQELPLLVNRTAQFS